jgi:hypothetical protein
VREGDSTSGFQNTTKDKERKMEWKKRKGIGSKGQDLERGGSRAIPEFPVFLPWTLIREGAQISFRRRKGKTYLILLKKKSY